MVGSASARTRHGDAPIPTAAQRRRPEGRDGGGADGSWSCADRRVSALAAAACTIIASNKAGIAEAHFGLGRVPVDVDLARIRG